MFIMCKLVKLVKFQLFRFCMSNARSGNKTQARISKSEAQVCIGYHVLEVIKLKKDSTIEFQGGAQ
jgi:hypothetical protein